MVDFYWKLLLLGADGFLFRFNLNSDFLLDARSKIHFLFNKNFFLPRNFLLSGVEVSLILI